MNILHMLEGGQERISVPVSAYIGILCTIIYLLNYLVTIPVKNLSTNSKRALSIPLLVANAFFPAFIKIDMKYISCGTLLACFGSLMRFTEIIWTGPFLYGREAYVPSGFLSEEFWKILREFPKQTVKNTVSKEKQPEEYFKDKKYYHIILPWIGNVIICDICTSFLVTYTMKDINEIYSKLTLPSLLFFCLTVVTFTTLLNSFGYIAQFIYVVYYEGGTYSSKQWRSMTRRPILSKSLNEFWAPRWHRLVRAPMVAFVHKPVYDYSKRFLSRFTENSDPLARVASLFSTFFISGIMHEYIFLWNIGWPVYKERFLWTHQTQFTLYGIIMPLELLITHIASKSFPESWKNSSLTLWSRRIITLILSRILLWPVFESFHYYGIRYTLPFNILRPYVYEVIHQWPILKHLCGSDI
ncbi:hypothetical protein CLU79DRAFT_839015 [Phycomyces nitens]|nr:hypothetical protein CLU79DRAFT_839015 [Phycomyces nitens]